MSAFLEAVEKRRSIYTIENDCPVSDDEIAGIVKKALAETPSAFNSQTGRVVLLLGAHHHKLWDLVLEALKPVTSPERLAATQQKIAGFAAGHGSILFFEEQETIAKLQAQFALYKEHFPGWSMQASGMLQFVVWTALADAGVGATLQHYNPLIDAAVRTAWNIPASWKLVAQMPFGRPTASAGPKERMAMEKRFWRLD